jgi:large repetitive protein
VHRFRVHRGTGHHRKTPQAITFERPLAAAVGHRVTLAASATSGLAVSFRSDTPSVCRVSGATVTATVAGTCAITASQPGNARFAAARDVRRSFAVHAGAYGSNHGKQISQAIVFGQLPAAAVGQLVLLSASATSGLAVSFSSDTPAVCSVSGTSVTAMTAGTCTVMASQAGSARYLAAPDVAQSFQVHAGHQAQTIRFPRPPEAKVGGAATLAASATSGLPVAFRSDTPRICTVSGATVTAAAAGTCTVTASQDGSGHYAAARDVAQSFDVASPASIPTGVLTIVLAAAVFAAAGVTALVRRVRRRLRPPLGPQPTVRAAPVPGPPALVSVQNTGAGVTHTVRIESSPGASITRIKEDMS